MVGREGSEDDAQREISRAALRLATVARVPGERFTPLHANQRLENQARNHRVYQSTLGAAVRPFGSRLRSCGQHARRSLYTRHVMNPRRVDAT